MQTTKWTLLIGGLAGFLLLVLSGCSAAVMEATHCVYNHVRGDLVGIVPYHVEQVLPVTATVIKELDGYELVEQKSNFLKAYIIAYDRKARKVQIDLSRTEENQTKIQIRIGMIGNKLESSMIFNYVVNRLTKEDPLNYLYSKKSKE